MCYHPIRLKNKYVPCGKCMDCLVKKSREWAFRINLEASLYEKNCMLTLTYNEVNRPHDDHLSKKDLQKFIKRLRKFVKNDKIRYFACGEYGEKNKRPHYHIIIFNYDFEDKFYFFTDKKGSKLYRSYSLEKLWQFGFSTIGEVNFDTAKYCAVYLQKPPKPGMPRAFTLMSKKPGIGWFAFDYSWLQTDKIYVKGKYNRIPRYYIDKAEKDGANIFGVIDRLKFMRKKNEYISFISSLDYKPINLYQDFPLEGVFFDAVAYEQACEERRQKYKNIFGKDFFEKI